MWLIARGFVAMVCVWVVILSTLVLNALKAPVQLHFVLWAVVVFRLICPVSYSAPFSLFNFASVRYDQKQAENFDDTFLKKPKVIHVEGSPGYDEAVAAGIEPQDANVADLKAVFLEEDGVTPAKTVADIMNIVIAVWLGGLAAVWLYALGSYIYLRVKTRTAVLLEGNIYESDGIKSPFVMGFLQPRIYLPFGVEDEHRRYIIEHERVHIERLDHITKPAVFAICSLFWFHHISWLASAVVRETMESSCDERVIRRLGERERENYCAALLNYSIKFFGISPVAFCEAGGVRARIKSVMSYRHPGKWKLAASVVFTIAVCVLCLANPT